MEVELPGKPIGWLVYPNTGLSLVYSTLYYLATICNIVPLAKQVAHTLLGNRSEHASFY